MTEDTIKKLHSIEELKIEERRVKAQSDELIAEVIDEIGEDEKIVGVHGTFTKGKRITYIYSEEVQQADADLKSKKKSEEISGNAKTKKVSEFITYRTSKAE